MMETYPHRETQANVHHISLKLGYCWSYDILWRAGMSNVKDPRTSNPWRNGKVPLPLFPGWGSEGNINAFLWSTCGFVIMHRKCPQQHSSQLYGYLCRKACSPTDTSCSTVCNNPASPSNSITNTRSPACYGFSSRWPSSPAQVFLSLCLSFLHLIATGLWPYMN